jgi:two-component system response regulator GlrR
MNNGQNDILLVDDDEGLRRLLAMRLKSVGYHVESVESAEAAMACLSSVQPRLVITDMRMSGMDGMALFDAVHQRRPDIPVIILTAYGTIPDAVKAAHAGVFGFLSKPFDSKDLLEQVGKALKLSSESAVSDVREDAEWRREIITRSQTMEEVLAEARLVARSDASVFITGESGTGKELLAKAVHRASPRHSKTFVAVNCSAIPADLLESELFGHTKGAFTGATYNYEGLFRAADGGTLFLDEIGDMPLTLQVKLLRALQERQIRPVGSTQSYAVDVRIISATHRNLEDLLESGELRNDIYYRLNVVTLSLPPLRERREDIPMLANYFLHEIAKKNGRKLNAFAPDALDSLVSGDWPGNVRQLYNAVEYCVAGALCGSFCARSTRPASRSS